MTTIKLKAEATTVAETKEKRLAPRGAAPTFLDTEAQRMTQAVTALHQHGIGRGLQFVGRRLVNAVETG